MHIYRDLMLFLSDPSQFLPKIYTNSAIDWFYYEL